MDIIVVDARGAGRKRIGRAWLTARQLGIVGPFIKALMDLSKVVGSL